MNYCLGSSKERKIYSIKTNCNGCMLLLKIPQVSYIIADLTSRIIIRGCSNSRIVFRKSENTRISGASTTTSETTQ